MSARVNEKPGSGKGRRGVRIVRHRPDLFGIPGCANCIKQVYTHITKNRFLTHNGEMIMKATTMFACGLISTILVAGSTCVSFAQGMPAGSRANIHLLFDQHQQIERSVTLTETGYTATTSSTNPVVAAALQAHVGQMEERLEAGLMVRRWDPAFAEYVATYSEIQHTFAKIPGGIKATVTGTTPDAILIAQNHAQVIADFAAHGWAAHDRSHTAAIRTSNEAAGSESAKDHCQSGRAQPGSETTAPAVGGECCGSDECAGHGGVK